MSLPSCVLDANVAVKLFLDEPFTAEVTMLFSEYIAHPEHEPFVVPDLFYIECANILWKRVMRRKDLEAGLARQHIADLRQLELPAVSMATLAERAVEIGMIYDITAYDASYVVLAEERAVPLLTGDQRLINALAGSPFTLVSIAGVCGQLSRGGLIRNYGAPAPMPSGPALIYFP